MIKRIKKVLVLGSGALKIGEAGEFDYSGSQAIKALREEKIEIVLINPNIATVQTSKDFADKIYFLPVNPYFVKKVIAKERPDGILLTFGGQTALNCGVELAKTGVLKKYRVRVLGTQIDAIIKTEDRALFKQGLSSIGVKVPHSIALKNPESALKAADRIGFPIIVRAAYSLGGKGSGIAKDRNQLELIVKRALAHTPQILIEEYLCGWKEVEYEVVRDIFNNCITVCNMENFDPLGIHTGESIVVAPSQTLTNQEYHFLREISIRVIKHFKIVGECNIQFALAPDELDYRVIEVNARLSRSSALASKATGYPLAYIAAKLALGYSLIELKNPITKVTTACFEPALDYIVTKVPRWDLGKFQRVTPEIGTEMKSVGEVMAIDRTFEASIQKATRMLNIGIYGLVGNKTQFNQLIKKIRYPTDKRLFVLMDGLKNGLPIEKINQWSGIDKWFLYKLKNVISCEKELRKYRLAQIPKELLLRAKKLGFSDKQIAMLIGDGDELKVRNLRKKSGVLPVVKQIDTLAAEWPAQTNYLYLTYNGTEHDIKFDLNNSVLVLGSGAYSIGSSVEFDWCGVNAVQSLKKLGYNTIMINFNPETVSTDYDICDRLYFEELSLERVLDIYDIEKPLGVIIATGGQIPNNLALKLHKVGVRILGTSPLSIDRAEDRRKFSRLCDQLDIDQPAWKELKTADAAQHFAKSIGYPVLVRPSYVLSGQAMSVAFKGSELKRYLHKAASVSEETPVVISKFITNAREIEIDAVANKGELVIWVINEHVENAGVHSGDATMVIPPQKTYLETIKRIKEIARKIAWALKITGPFNIQFLAQHNEIKVIECNLRASRSFPFVSKVSGINFIDLAVRSIMNRPVPQLERSVLELDYVGVKAPQFSFFRLRGADPILSVEMASTGEVACLGSDLEDAFLKSIIATGFDLPKENVLVSIGGDENRYYLLNSISLLKEHGFNLFATDHTSKFLTRHGIKNQLIYKAHQIKEPNIITYLSNQKLDLIICIPDQFDKKLLRDEYIIRRNAVDFSVPLLTNCQLTKLFVEAVIKKDLNQLEIKHWMEYQK
ncbi:MAG: carbamoyl-phosphate synthase (glutamine-hydrolyzing) large subunit [bacterium]